MGTTCPQTESTEILNLTLKNGNFSPRLCISAFILIFVVVQVRGLPVARRCAGPPTSGRDSIAAPGAGGECHNGAACNPPRERNCATQNATTLSSPAYSLGRLLRSSRYEIREDKTTICCRSILQTKTVHGRVLLKHSKMLKVPDSFNVTRGAALFQGFKHHPDKSVFCLRASFVFLPG